MAKPKRHIQNKTRRRTFRNEAESKTLVKWLNECDDAAAQRRVRKIMADLGTLCIAQRELPKKMLNVENPLLKRFKRMKAAIDRQLAGFEGIPQLLTYRVPQDNYDDYVGFYWRPTKKWPVRGRQGTQSANDALAEFNAVMRILRLGSDILGVQFCSCSKAFYPRLSHQRFCSEGCRLSFYAKDEKWQTYRRNKAREYYWLHKSGKVK